jgi:hypothetical protein
MSEVLKRFICAKHHGFKVMNLMAGTELVCTWTRENVDAYIASLNVPDAAAPDVLAELIDEGVSYADAQGAPVLFAVVFLNGDSKVVHSRPWKCTPSKPTEVGPSQSSVAGEDFDKVVKALLRSNDQMREHSDSLAKSAERLLQVAQITLEAVQKTKLEASTVLPATVLSEEEKEALIQRTAFIGQLSKKAPEVVDLFIGAAAKYLKLGEGAELAAQTAAHAALAVMNGKSEAPQ